MSTQATSPSNDATGSPPAPNGANAEQPAAQNDSGTSSAEQDFQAKIDKAVGAGMERERERLNKEYAPKLARLAELEAQAEASKLDGMKPDELLEKYKESQGQLQEFKAREAERSAKRAETLKTQADALQAEDAKAFVLGQIEAGNLDSADAFMKALPSGHPPKASDPSANPNNPSANIGISEAEVQRYRDAAQTGDNTVLKELSDKHGWDALRKADTELSAQGK
jgi:hypothetical protein